MATTTATSLVSMSSTLGRLAAESADRRTAQRVESCAQRVERLAAEGDRLADRLADLAARVARAGAVRSRPGRALLLPNNSTVTKEVRA